MNTLSYSRYERIEMKESVTVEKFRELFETRDAVAAEWKKT